VDPERVLGLGLDIDLAVRRHDVPVLITAPDLGLRRRLAQHIHDHSSGTRTFVMVHSVDEWEMDPSQLRQATVFIDDVRTYDQGQQAALMRLLNSRVMTAPSRWRVITASDARLYDSVLDGSFRADLYYRLSVMHIVISE
jgi:transcriptional regulator of acetoin/glycerol metabolism